MILLILLASLNVDDHRIATDAVLRTTRVG